MNATSDDAAERGEPKPRKLRTGRRIAIGLTGLGLVLLLAALALRVALRPEFATRLILQRASAALGLDITVTGAVGLRLRGTPQLTAEGVSAREPGAATPVLRARRVVIAVPWSTIRSRGAVLEVERIELDGPVLDLPALEAWQAKRPPSASPKVPTLTRGLGIRDGRIDSGAWYLDGIALEIPRLRADEAVRAHVRGRYRDTPTVVGFNLRLAMTRPTANTGVAANGGIALFQGDWRLPAHVRLSGPMQFDGEGLRISPLRLAMAASYQSGKTRLPFVLGLHGPLRYEKAVVSLEPAGVALRGQGALPSFDARGAFAVGTRLVLRLQGRLANWNPAWPALPPPLGQSKAPLPFSIVYAGSTGMADIATLNLQRDTTRFDGRFKLPQVLAWIDASNAGSPLPPLDGRITTPRLDISGAQLHGVEVDFDDPDVPQP